MTKPTRSPVLGYNHNLRYGGRVFHIQTEDSGPGYARLYTHLFFEGTILSSKKHEYDPAAPEDAVRALMQQLHKAMIRELTRAEHDARIGGFFIARGEPPMLDDGPAVTAAGDPGGLPDVAAAPARPLERVEPPPAPAPQTPTPAPQVGIPQLTPRPLVIAKPPLARRPPVVTSGSAEGVVVRRNVVIDVGGGQPPVSGGNGADPPGGGADPTARQRPALPYAVRDGAYATSAASRPAPADPQPRSSPQTQPLASAREIKMPWETPGPTRMSQPVLPAVAEAAPSAAGREIRMPWDTPQAAASQPAAGPAPEPFAEKLVSDKSLDEVILEYLSDDGETQDP